MKQASSTTRRRSPLQELQAQETVVLEQRVLSAALVRLTQRLVVHRIPAATLCEKLGIKYHELHASVQDQLAQEKLSSGSWRSTQPPAQDEVVVHPGGRSEDADADAVRKPVGPTSPCHLTALVQDLCTASFRRELLEGERALRNARAGLSVLHGKLAELRSRRDEALERCGVSAQQREFFEALTRVLDDPDEGGCSDVPEGDSGDGSGDSVSDSAQRATPGWSDGGSHQASLSRGNGLQLEADAVYHSLFPGRSQERWWRCGNPMAQAGPTMPPQKAFAPRCGCEGDHYWGASAPQSRTTGSLGRAPEAERPADMAAEGSGVTEAGMLCVEGGFSSIPGVLELQGRLEATAIENERLTRLLDGAMREVKELLGKNKELRAKAKGETHPIRAELTATRQNASIERQRLSGEPRAAEAGPRMLQAEASAQDRIQVLCSLDAGEISGCVVPATVQAVAVGVAEVPVPVNAAVVDSIGGSLEVPDHRRQQITSGRAAFGEALTAEGDSEPGDIIGSPVKGRTGLRHPPAEREHGMRTGSGDGGDEFPSSPEGILEGAGALDPNVRRNLRGVFLEAERQLAAAPEKPVGVTRSREDEAAAAYARERELEGELETAQAELAAPQRALVDCRALALTKTKEPHKVRREGGAAALAVASEAWQSAENLAAAVRRKLGTMGEPKEPLRHSTREAGSELVAENEMVEAQLRLRTAEEEEEEEEEEEADAASREAFVEGRASSIAEMTRSRERVADLETTLEGLERRCEEQARTIVHLTSSREKEAQAVRFAGTELEKERLARVRAQDRIHELEVAAGGLAAALKQAKKGGTSPRGDRCSIAIDGIGLATSAPSRRAAASLSAKGFECRGTVDTPRMDRSGDDFPPDVWTSWDRTSSQNSASRGRRVGGAPLHGREGTREAREREKTRGVIFALEEAMRSARSEVVALTRRVSRLRAGLREAERRANTMEADAASARASASAAEAALKAAALDTEAAVAAKQEMRIKVRTSEQREMQRVSDLMKDVQRARDETSVANDVVAEAKAEVSRLRGELSKADRRVAMLEERVAMLAADLRTAEAERARAQMDLLRGLVQDGTGHGGLPGSAGTRPGISRRDGETGGARSGSGESLGIELALCAGSERCQAVICRTREKLSCEDCLPTADEGREGLRERLAASQAQHVELLRASHEALALADGRCQARLKRTFAAGVLSSACCRWRGIAAGRDAAVEAAARVVLLRRCFDALKAEALRCSRDRLLRRHKRVQRWVREAVEEASQEFALTLKARRDGEKDAPEGLRRSLVILRGK